MGCEEDSTCLWNFENGGRKQRKTSQGMQVASKIYKSQGNRPYPEPTGQNATDLDFSPQSPVRLPTNRTKASKFVLFYNINFVVLCYSYSRKTNI